ncbi:MAG: HAD-IIIC family phosphatase [Deltaproteobacteria bacterium]|nr:HAD-IIIC family phosphatase [Deltaproteobacteria bacterium]
MELKTVSIFDEVIRALKPRPNETMLERLQSNLRYAQEVATSRPQLRGFTRVGPLARTAGKPLIENEGTISVGERLLLTCTFSPAEFRCAAGATIELGDRVTVNFGTLLSAHKSVRLGHRVAIGPYSLISDTLTTLDAGQADGPEEEALPIEIGDDVWLAARVTVLPGAKIGSRSVITAGSVVSGEIPEGVVAGGIPARVMGKVGAPGEALLKDAPRTTPTQMRPVAPLVPLTAQTFARRGALLISDFTIDPLVPALMSGAALPAVRAQVAPYGQVSQTLLTHRDAEEVGLVWTRPESTLASLQRRLDGAAVTQAEVLAEVDAFCELVLRAAPTFRGLFVCTWVLPAWERGLGMLDAGPNGVSRLLLAANLRLMERLGEARGVHVLNAQRWMEAGPRGGSSLKLWYEGKTPFHPDVLLEAALDLRAGVAGLEGGAKKLLVLDLDDTLWGGIVGDQGWENLRLGGHDPVGEALVDFQRAVKALKRRGVLLAIVSKNTESVALEAIRKHPSMVLREEDFSAHRINWKDKAANILELVQQLKLGLQSVVFIDDNPVERARVREALPEVLVPEWPEDKVAYPRAFAALRCFDAPAMSAEDLRRGELYEEEAQREAARAQVGSIDEWLKSLELRVQVERLQAHNLVRVTQLLNKTNQLNLTTRRLTEAELEGWARQDGREVYAFSVRDRFGDAGLTGILGLEKDGGKMHIADYVLSCRVMGRKVEETLLHVAVERARAAGCARVEARLKPTAKNLPCVEFFKRSGFAEERENEFGWDATRPYALSEFVRLELRP